MRSRPPSFFRPVGYKKINEFNGLFFYDYIIIGSGTGTLLKSASSIENLLGVPVTLIYSILSWTVCVTDAYPCGALLCHPRVRPQPRPRAEPRTGTGLAAFVKKIYRWAKKKTIQSAKPPLPYPHPLITYIVYLNQVHLFLEKIINKWHNFFFFVQYWCVFFSNSCLLFSYQRYL